MEVVRVPESVLEHVTRLNNPYSVGWVSGYRQTAPLGYVGVTALDRNSYTVGFLDGSSARREKTKLTQGYLFN